jgi:excisionase family DNA binding protein
MENNKQNIPMLLPYDPNEFLNQIRNIIKEEINKVDNRLNQLPSEYDTPGITEKPLFKIIEVCRLFSVSRSTIYEWIKHGKLKPYKVRSRLYFLWNDLQEMLKK